MSITSAFMNFFGTRLPNSPTGQLYWQCAVLTVCVASAHAAGPTNQLNDTGLTQALGSTGGLLTCNAYNTGDSAAYPRQDCRFGRDALAAVSGGGKAGGGSAGFDFTPLNAAGSPIPLTAAKTPSATPSCVKDNITNLIWEVKTGDGGLHDAKWHYAWRSSNFTTNGGYPGVVAPTTFCGEHVAAGCDTESYVAAVNTAGLCGSGSPWRLPTMRELLSIAHFGVPTQTRPIDTDFFPNENPITFVQTYSSYGGLPAQTTVAPGYWSSDTYRGNPSAAWVLDLTGVFGVNLKGYYTDGYGNHWIATGVRLVRDGP